VRIWLMASTMEPEPVPPAIAVAAVSLQTAHGATHDGLEVQRIVAVAKIIGDEGAAKTATLAADAGADQRTHLVLHHLDVGGIEESLQAGEHLDIVQCRGADAVDVHLLALAEVHALAEHAPAIAVVEVLDRGVDIDIIDKDAVAGFVPAELFENTFAELADHFAAGTAQSDNEMVCHNFDY